MKNENNNKAKKRKKTGVLKRLLLFHVVQNQKSRMNKDILKQRNPFLYNSFQLYISSIKITLMSVYFIIIIYKSSMALVLNPDIISYTTTRKLAKHHTYKVMSFVLLWSSSRSDKSNSALLLLWEKQSDNNL